MKKIYYIATFISFTLLVTLGKHFIPEETILKGWWAVLVWGSFINFFVFLSLFAKDRADGRI